MKGILVILLFISIISSLRAQPVGLAWVTQTGSAEYHESVNSMALDASNNVYTTGSFRGSVDFDPGPGVVTLNADDYTIFICKLDSEGHFVWAKRMIGAQQAMGTGLAITLDANGNIYTTGSFQRTVDFDPGQGIFNLTAAGSNMIFVSKLDAAGNFVWAKQFGAISQFQGAGSAIVTDAAGNVFTSGSFLGTGDFNPGTDVFNLGTQGNMAFVSKLDINGNFVWAKQMGGLSNGGVGDKVSLALDSRGNVYTSGSFFGLQDFDPGPATVNLTAPNNGARDVFISKLNAAGNFVWVKQIGGDEHNYCASMVIDGQDNIYTTGSFQGITDFDPGIGIYKLNAFGINDIFISKLNAEGNFIWTKQMGGTTNAIGHAITLDATGNVYTTGAFNDTVDFNPGPGVYDLEAPGDFDVFVAKLDIFGNFIWAVQMGGTRSSVGYSIAVDVSNNIYTSGYFDGTADFDPGAGLYGLTSNGSHDMFIHKLSACGKTSYSSLTVSGCKTYSLNNKTYAASGVYSQTLVNAAGCDSIISLDLTINRTNTAMNAVACKTYRWNNKNYSESGSYTDTLVGTNGCDSLVTLNLTISSATFSTITQSICTGESYAGHNKAGIYIDTFMAANGCDSIRTVHLDVLKKPAPDLGADKSICPGDVLVLTAGTFSSYLWQDGNSTNSLSVTQPGLYSVVVTNTCGSSRDEVLVKPGICDIYFSSAFTPNNDGNNDLFKILGARDLSNYHLVIFNRLGQKLFESRDYTKGWDGHFKGQPQEPGTYIWYCKFTKVNAPRNTIMKGSVLLIR